MTDAGDLLNALRERAKELNCLYQVEQALTAQDVSTQQVLDDVVKALAPGWQYPEVCEAQVRLEDEVHATEGYHDSPWKLSAPICVQDEVVGELTVGYVEERPTEDEGPFLRDEVRLIQSLADRLGHWLLYRRLRHMGRRWQEVGVDDTSADPEWRVLVDLLHETDDSLYVRTARKMLNHLCSIGIEEAQTQLREIDAEYNPMDTGTGESNVPESRSQIDQELLETGRPFEIAGRHLSSQEIISLVQEWVQVDKASQFLKVLDNPRSTLGEVREALRRFHRVAPDGVGLPEATLKSVRVALCQRVLTEQLESVQTAAQLVTVEFFRSIMDRIIATDESHGKLGGKAAGMLLASRALHKHAKQRRESGDPTILEEIRIPRTWYVASDAVLDFMSYNDLEDLLHQKYRSIDEIRRDYPNIIRLFKNSTFPPSLVQSFSTLLDEFADCPLIVRSSSLLEDRVGSAFSGKYKSLFLPNQGSKKDRLAALLDAIAEVYASMFGPDPIQYRRERGVLEFDEQMGVLIQEVVGRRVGRWFFPSYAGVAFSRNEFRWSPRITRDDGLVRMVPGLGTRAVDRTGDDYPVLLVPGKPDLRANVAIDEVVRYSPRYVDLVNMDDNAFQTIELKELMEEVGNVYPALAQVFCRVEDGRLTKIVSSVLGDGKGPWVACFEGLRGQSKFVQQMRETLTLLEDTLHCPVDVEFAHDGEHLYLLQCRPQSQSDSAPPSPIPRDIPHRDIVFTAYQHVSNAHIPDIHHVVYVDPMAYAELEDLSALKKVGRAVGELNKLLPKKRFILMGPGRWGSRGDIKLGVSVTYADINNTAMLIEIARKTGSYVPDVSFGTHFFQDLVEARIGYLPIYPDDEDVVFAEAFLKRSENLLAELLPQFADLAEVVKVVDVPRVAKGRVLRVLLNADLNEAVAHLVEPDTETLAPAPMPTSTLKSSDQFWRWRKQMAERIGAEIERERLGVVAIYLFGSVKNATAGPSSDIDILVHFRGNEEQQRELLDWLDGWSRALAEFNYQRTGYRSEGLLDVHIVTDEDIAKRSSYAMKIDAVTDAAVELPPGE